MIQEKRQKNSITSHRDALNRKSYYFLAISVFFPLERISSIFATRSSEKLA